MMNKDTATLIANQTGGKLTADDVINLAEYGTTDANDMRPQSAHELLLEEGIAQIDKVLGTHTCVCGVANCPDVYSHTTSGV